MWLPGRPAAPDGFGPGAMLNIRRWRGRALPYAPGETGVRHPPAAGQTPPAGTTTAQPAPPAAGRGGGRGALTPYAKEALAALRAPLDRLTPVTEAMLRNPSPGDWLALRAKLGPPSRPVLPGGFDFQRLDFFRQVGGVGIATRDVRRIESPDGVGPPGTLSEVWANAWRGISAIRVSIAQRILAVLSGDSGTIAVALIAGDQYGISDGTMDDMRDSGLAHLLSISGLHILLVTTILFGGFVQADLPSGIKMMAQMKLELDAAGIPIMIIIMLLPFLGGFTSGTTLGFVSAGVSIVVGLLPVSPLLSQELAVMVLAYACGYVGLLLSPVHTCLVLTNRYFKTSLAHSILRMVPPCLVILAGAIGVYFLINAMGF